MPEPIRGTEGWMTRLDENGQPIGPRMPLTGSVEFQVDQDDDDLFTRQDAFTIQMRRYDPATQEFSDPVPVRVPLHDMLVHTSPPVRLRDVMARMEERVRNQARALQAARPGIEQAARDMAAATSRTPSDAEDAMQRALAAFRQVGRVFQVPPAALESRLYPELRRIRQAQQDAMDQQLLTPRGIPRDPMVRQAQSEQWWRDSMDALRRAGYAAWHRATERQGPPEENAIVASAGWCAPSEIVDELAAAGNRHLWEQEWVNQDSPQARQEAQYERDLINERAHRAMQAGSEELRLWDEMWEDPRLSMRWTGGDGERRAHP